MYSEQRCAEVTQYAIYHGVNKAAKVYGIKESSVKRVMRMCKQTAVIPTESLDGKVKILLLDIETSPLLAYCWGTYKQNISPVQIVATTELMSWAAKWLGGSVVAVDSREGEKDDKRLSQTALDIVNKADIVIAHNGNDFDLKVLNTRWMAHGMTPPAPYKSVDTLMIARGCFRFPSNKLEAIARYLGIGCKTEHEGFALWTKCLADDADAWERMRTYNAHDVELLEEIYLRLRAWDKKHANVALYFDDGLKRCVCCGSAEIENIPYVATTAVSVFGVVRCKDCGKVMRECTREKRDNVYRNVQ